MEQDVKRLGPIWNVPVSPGEVEQIFGHFWDHSIDKIQPKLQLFVGKKTRGAFKGVSVQQVETFVVTKRLMSSLIGQCYSLDGTFLSPVRCALKILFHQICSLTQDWNRDVSDTQVGKSCQQFLQVLKTKLTDLIPHERLIISPGFHPISIESFGDGSQFCASCCCYIVVECDKTRKSHICQAVSRLKNHSVPCNEVLGFTQATEMPINYYISHYNILKTTRNLNIKGE